MTIISFELKNLEKKILAILYGQLTRILLQLERSITNIGQFLEKQSKVKMVNETFLHAEEYLKAKSIEVLQKESFKNGQEQAEVNRFLFIKDDLMLFDLPQTGIFILYRILTGGKDSTICIVGPTLNLIAKIDMYTIVPDTCDGDVRALCINEANKTIGVGTKSSEIYEFKYNALDAKIESSIKSTVVNRGHYAPWFKTLNEVWGLHAFSDGDRFITCSDDATLRLWSCKQRKMLKHMRLDIDEKGVILGPDKATNELQNWAKLRSITVSADEKLWAIGCFDGTLRIVELLNWKQKAIIRHKNKWIQDLKFSPDGSKLVVGDHLGWIYFYQIPTFKMISKVKKHSSAITHIDWSCDSSYIHSNCQAYELLFFDTTGKQITSGASALRDEEWSRWS